MHLLAGHRARDDLGRRHELVLEGQTGQAASRGHGTRIWARRIGDQFYIDLSLLAMVNAGRWQTGPHRTCRPGGLRTRRTALPIPTSTPSSWKSPISTRSVRPGALTPACGAPRKLATDAGGWRQISSALGTPLMWPIFWPDDTDFSRSPSNTRHPSEDFNAVGKYIGDQVAAVVAATGTSDDPQGLRPDRRPGGCSPTCCPTWSERPRSTGSPPATAERRPTTHPRQCCPSWPTPPCRRDWKPSVAEHLREQQLPLPRASPDPPRMLPRTKRGPGPAILPAGVNGTGWPP